MTRFVIALLVLVSASGAEFARAAEERVAMNVAVEMLGGNSVKISVRNPATGMAVCASKSQWIYSEPVNDQLAVRGRDGKRWEFIGYWVEPSGDYGSDTLRLEPGETISGTVDVTRTYRPPAGADTHLGGVTYEAFFTPCP